MALLLERLFHYLSAMVKEAAIRVDRSLNFFTARTSGFTARVWD
jgi:hypothetical protein